MTALIIGLVIGFVAGIFVYRNNAKRISPIADKVDEKFDERFKD